MKHHALFLALFLVLGGSFLFALIVSCGDDDDDSGDDSDDAATDDDASDDDNIPDDDDIPGDDDDNDDDSATPPTFPSNHAETWDCYLCHETSLQGVTTPEPHEHEYIAPDRCVQCHVKGTWSNDPYAGGHNWSMDCLTCHSDKHGKTGWADKTQCLVCHGQAAGDDEDDDK